MSKIRVVVTQDHIDRGIPKDGCWCPIARAIRDLGDNAFDGLEIEVDELLVRVGDQTGKLPPEGLAFIEAFDEGRPVAPLAFDLDLTHEPYEDRGYEDRGY